MARKIFGKINVEGAKPAGIKLRVVAWDADMDDDDHMGTALVNDDGSYLIEYADMEWDWSPIKPVTSWRPDIFIRVHKKPGPGVAYRSPTNQNVINITGVRIDAKIGE